MRKVLSPALLRTFKKLSTPQKVQHYLDRFPINFSQTHHSPKFSIERGSMQCLEGALVAAAALAYHGRAPLLLDLRTLTKDEDHVVALFEEGECWGAVSKTNHAILRYRDPIYASVRELVLSYFHEYALDTGEKTLREFSEPFDLRQFQPERWVTAQGNLWWLAEALDNSPHAKILPNGMSARMLRPISPIERKALLLTQWRKSKNKKPRKRKR